MARMTATDFVGFTRKRMGNPSTDEWTDNELLRFVNLAIVRVAAAHQPRTLETSTDITTTSGTAEYEFSVANILRITSVKNVTDGGVVKPDSRGDYTRSTSGTTAVSGAVQRYLESGTGTNDRKQVVLFCTPEGTKTIRFWYTKIPTEIVLSPTATSPETPQEFDETILDYAAEIGQKHDQQMREAQATRTLAADPEGRAASAKPLPPRRRWGIEAPIAASTKTRDR